MKLCGYHRTLYATKAKKLERRVRWPGLGRKALTREADTIRKQCPWCP